MSSPMHIIALAVRAAKASMGAIGEHRTLHKTVRDCYASTAMPCVSQRPCSFQRHRCGRIPCAASAERASMGPTMLQHHCQPRMRSALSCPFNCWLRGSPTPRPRPLMTCSMHAVPLQRSHQFLPRPTMPTGPRSPLASGFRLTSWSAALAADR